MSGNTARRDFPFHGTSRPADRGRARGSAEDNYSIEFLCGVITFAFAQQAWFSVKIGVK
jgi:hypothetical protein